MSYTWLKRFDVKLAEAYPYIKVILSIVNIWKTSAPFYTFTVRLKIGPNDLGVYLYVGDCVGKHIDLGRDFRIEAYLKIIDVHAKTLRDQWTETLERKRELEISIAASVCILNYQYPLGSLTKRIPYLEAKKWLSREGEMKNDFIPFSASSALYALLFKDISSIREDVERAIESRIKKIEPLIIIFEKGMDEYRKAVEKNVEQRYEFLKPFMELFEAIKEVSNGRLDENWALSTLSLTVLENIVNMKLKQLGESISGDFSERVSKIRRALIKREKWDERKASDLARRLIGKYRERHIVVHGGYENPTSKEAALEDLRFIKEVMERLFKQGPQA